MFKKPLSINKKLLNRKLLSSPTSIPIFIRFLSAEHCAYGAAKAKIQVFTLNQAVFDLGVTNRPPYRQYPSPKNCMSKVYI